VPTERERFNLLPRPGAAADSIPEIKSLSAFAINLIRCTLQAFCRACSSGRLINCAPEGGRLFFCGVYLDFSDTSLKNCSLPTFRFWLTFACAQYYMIRACATYWNAKRRFLTFVSPVRIIHGECSSRAAARAENAKKWKEKSVGWAFACLPRRCQLPTFLLPFTCHAEMNSPCYSLFSVIAKQIM
jgi:hypothetical protein